MTAVADRFTQVLGAERGDPHTNAAHAELRSLRASWRAAARDILTDFNLPAHQPVYDRRVATVADWPKFSTVEQALVSCRYMLANTIAEAVHDNPRKAIADIFGQDALLALPPAAISLVSFSAWWELWLSVIETVDPDRSGLSDDTLAGIRPAAWALLLEQLDVPRGEAPYQARPKAA